MKVSNQPRGVSDPAVRYELAAHAALLNLMADGRLAGTHNVGTSAPVSGVHATGDFRRNSAPAEAGTAGSMYVVFGWVCVAGGEPGTWVDCRVLTGN